MISRVRMLINALLIIGIFILGFVTSRFYPGQTQPSNEKKILYWVAPMDPNYRSDKPGKSPMGMDLVPVYEKSQTSKKDATVVSVDPHIKSSMGIKTSQVVVEDVYPVIKTLGYAVPDENTIEHVSTFIDGWVHELVAKETDRKIKKGDVIYKLYSPKLIQAQDEYLLALRSQDQNLIKGAKQRLQTFGVDQSQIDTLRKTGKTSRELEFFAPISGVISALHVREGMFIKPETPIMTIEDLTHIWIIAEVLEKQSNLVAVGQQAIATFPYIPDKKWIGKIDYIYPTLDPKTHTLRVRMTFPNSDYQIKPNMFANIEIKANPIKQAITIPKSSLIRSADGDRVILNMADGNFKPTDVLITREIQDKYIVSSGLGVGDQVVTNGQFLIDSESNINAAFARMGSEMELISTKRIMSEGVVKKISKQEVIIQHEYIPEINMSAMHMKMKPAPGLHLESVKVGEIVHFVFETSSNDEFELVEIHRLTRE